MSERLYERNYQSACTLGRCSFKSLRLFLYGTLSSIKSYARFTMICIYVITITFCCIYNKYPRLDLVLDILQKYDLFPMLYLSSNRKYILIYLTIVTNIDYGYSIATISQRQQIYFLCFLCAFIIKSRIPHDSPHRN